ncbi:single-stranded DNA-binding protein [Microbacterium sp. VKM Ac-2870]|uniref:single-stranded DNA-binding protein n=1 Tax=Microbacterium sp. VKM Ac-2870 TaxID=2783825 RepID=UPI00188B3DA1|nr:single-stranded DNA-binding protein [Microbacterium sp. VKM Ac-2870]MBF4563355.1 single-stranded DNA-binding protein [Microbacterium sp. VKM Ac-2870]
MSSYIVRTGNLAATPELRHGENGPYTFARILVSDGIRQEDGTYLDGPTIAYDVAVSGDKAVKLVDAATESGNIRIMFAGRYRITQYQSENGPRLQHRVNADEIAVSLTGQTIRVIKTTTPDPADYGDDTPF